MPTQQPVAYPNQPLNSGQIGKVVCVGRNYADHARELGNAVPTQPLLFMKPASCVVTMAEGIVPPEFGGGVHYEAELCVQLGADLCCARIDEARAAIAGVTLGLDLTLRQLQNELKAKGHPWERAKCFDGACVLGDWLPASVVTDWSQLHYQLYINDRLRQDGHTASMLVGVAELLVEISHAFTLQTGDVVMTGTPSGVGELQTGDVLCLQLAVAGQWVQWRTQVL